MVPTRVEILEHFAAHNLGTHAMTGGRPRQAVGRLARGGFCEQLRRESQHPMPDQQPARAAGRKYPGFLTPLVAWVERRDVDEAALDLFRPMHRNRWLRPQIEAKLKTLDLTQPLHGELFLRVKQSLELFEAIDAGTYPRPNDWEVLEPWLQRALAYFISHEDAIPDHFADGFEDDHREFNDLANRLGPVLDHFAAWQAHRREESGG